MTTREQDNLIEQIALIAGRVRVEQLAGGNVSVTVIIDPDGGTVDTSEGEGMDTQENAAIASAVDRGEEDRARDTFGDQRVDRWFSEVDGVNPDAMRAGW